ncbi:unnamed protein product [Mytilus coruscus]|uniref:DUF3504 domain-containing protein n=1 Tax=Mytilus coruscus TaxID=42192 RepID=A0A6J8E2P3_MYTCO|nr:unnamed protein product [Mytilus coruscus]
MKKRSAEGLGAASRRKAEPISSLEENILWERAVIGSDNPPKLLDTMVPKEEVDAFYFKPLVNFTKDQWFCKVPKGHNTLQKTVKRLCTAFGLEGKRHRSNAVRSYKGQQTSNKMSHQRSCMAKSRKLPHAQRRNYNRKRKKTSHDKSHQVVNTESVRRESVTEPTTLSLTFNIKL